MPADDADSNGRATIREVYDLVDGMEERLLARMDRLEDGLRGEHKSEIARLESRIKTDEKVGWMGSLLAALAAAMAVAAHEFFGR